MIAPAQQLPPEVARYIDRFVARRRRQRLLRAAARALLVTVVWALAWCAVDRLLALDPPARAAALLANAAIAAAIVARPAAALVRRVDRNVAAAEIERREPRLSQRLATITSRLGDGGGNGGGGAYGSSRELLDALAREVADEMRGGDPAALLSWRPVLRPVLACAIWLALAGVLTLSSWLDLPTLARRYFAPLAGVPPVTTTRLAVTPRDAEVAQGEPLRVQASVLRLTGGRSPSLHVRPGGAATAADEPWHVEPMTAAADGRFEAEIARVDRDLLYFVTGGDARSETFRVAMLPRPAVRRFRVRYAYPPHTGLAPREVENETGVIEAPLGTDVALAIETTRPLDYAVLTIGAESTRVAPAPAAAASSRPPVVQTTFTITADRRYTLRMVSERGVSGVFRGGTIRAIADRAPLAQFRDTAAVEGGGGNDGGAVREVGGGDVLPVGYQAVDDYGLARLDLDVRVIRRSGAEASAVIPVPLTRNPREQQGVVPVDVRRFGLNTGDALELRLQAEDGAGQFALSAPTRFTVTSPAPPAPSAPPPSAPADAVASNPPGSPSQPQPQPLPSMPAAPPQSLPLDPPGYADAIRAYFEALRRAVPTTQP